MARVVVVLPVVTVVEQSGVLSPDQAVGIASSWLALPANAGAIVASKVLEGKTYNAEQFTNAQLAGSGRSVVQEPLAKVNISSDLRLT